MLHIEEGLMTSVNEAVIQYIAAWNERDPERRHDLVTRTWTEDGTYIDAHRQAVGHDGIDAMLAECRISSQEIASVWRAGSRLITISFASAGPPVAHRRLRCISAGPIL